MRHVLPVWLAAVILLSFIPLKFKLLLGTTGTWHSWGHYGIFLTTTLLTAWSRQSTAGRFVRAASVFLFAIFLEAGEVLLYRNTFEWHDVLVDALGVLSGLVFAQFSFGKRLKTGDSVTKSPSNPRIY